MKKTYIMFIIAGVLAIIAFLLNGFSKSESNIPLQSTDVQVEQQTPTEDEYQEEIARIDENITPIPTATPKPLPTATPTPIPTATPVSTEEPNEESFGNDNIDSMTTGEMENLESSVPGRIFIGDERMQTLSAYSYDDTDKWMCRTTADATWLLETACPAVSEHLVNGSTIIISLGLSDLSKVNDYITIINTYVPTWKDKGCKVYFVSLGPVDSDSYITNEDIMAFNTAIFNNTNCGFVDTYNYLATEGFATIDGVVYDGVTSQSVYDYIVANI